VPKNPADLAQTVQGLAQTCTPPTQAGSIKAPTSEAITCSRCRAQKSGTAAGATRFVLERQYGYPVSVVRTPQLANGDLSQFNVVILPDAGGFGGGESYASILGSAGMRRLKDWVQAGGTLIGVGSGAVTFLADARSQLLSISQENQPRATGETPRAAERSGSAPTPSTGAPPAADARVPGKLLASEADFEKAIQPDTDQPDSLHGVLLRAKVDPEHWSTAGAPDTVNVLVQGRSIFTPIKMDKGINAAYYAGPDQLLASGYMWEQNRKQLAFKPFEVVQRDGRGFIIGFTSDPNFRGYMDGLNILFLNAAFRGPAHTATTSRGGEE